MPSAPEATRHFVRIWLPGAVEPVPSGVLTTTPDGRHQFTYLPGYLARTDAIALWDLPLHGKPIEPRPGLRIAGCLADAGPDLWGQRVVARAAGTDVTALPTPALLAAVGGDRIGGLEVTARPDDAVLAAPNGTLAELVEGVDRLEHGARFATDHGSASASADVAMLAACGVGGARPKALYSEGGTAYIAKFDSPLDTYPVLHAEAVATNLAARVGLNVARSRVVHIAGRDVQLVERFDRPGGGRRRLLVSALTLAGLPVERAGEATYWGLMDTLRTYAADPAATLRDLFTRVAFNMAVGNTDDHARNHAAFWDGTTLELTPAYDLCPELRPGYTEQAMAIGRDGWKRSHLPGLIGRASEFGVPPAEARDIVHQQLDAIRAGWTDAADECRLTAEDRAYLWQRRILNLDVVDGL